MPESSGCFCTSRWACVSAARVSLLTPLETAMIWFSLVTVRNCTRAAPPATAQFRAGSGSLLGVEVAGFRVVDDDRVGGLLRRQLELLRQLHPDPLGVQQPYQLRPVLQVRAGRVPERVPAAPVLGTQQPVQVGRVGVGER